MQRIQRKRQRGWRMPPKTLYVGRPSRWGNPYQITATASRADVVAQFKSAFWAGELDGITPATIRAAAAGYDFIACWCRLDKPCHADEYIRAIKQDED